MAETKLHKAASGDNSDVEGHPKRTAREHTARRLAWLQNVCSRPNITVPEMKIAVEFALYYSTLSDSKQDFFETGILYGKPSVGTLATSICFSRRGTQAALKRMEAAADLRIRRTKGGNNRKDTNRFIMIISKRTRAPTAAPDTRANADAYPCKKGSVTRAPAGAPKSQRDNNPRDHKGRDGTTRRSAAPGGADATRASPKKPLLKGEPLLEHLLKHPKLSHACQDASEFLSQEHLALLPNLKSLGRDYSTPEFLAFLLSTYRTTHALKAMLLKASAKVLALRPSFVAADLVNQFVHVNGDRNPADTEALISGLLTRVRKFAKHKKEVMDGDYA
jgi:hypothetical protein